MPSSDEQTAPPLYLELAPPPVAGAPVDHLFVFRDAGDLSRCGSGRFATDLFTLSVTRGDSGDGVPHLSFALPRPDFALRRAPFRGVVAGLRLTSRPRALPKAETSGGWACALEQVRQSDDGLPALVAALDGLARGLSFGPPPLAFSDRTGRRRTRVQTGVSRRRLAATQRFRQLLAQFARPTLPLKDLALDAGYYDQSHMSAACRAFAGRPPGALRSQVALHPFGLSLQDAHLKDRLRLVVIGDRKE